MSVLARRGRDEEFDRERELIGMRDTVVAATTAFMPTAGSSATLEAVDEALAQLVAAGAHLADAEQVKGLWIRSARYRLIDEQRSADAKRRDTTAVDDHPNALELSVRDDPGELLDEQRETWRVREILSVLRGEQRKWADAWYREVLSGSVAVGAQPRGLPEVLGWTSAKTEKTSQRARRKMAEFVTQRQAGVVCAEQRALLAAFITATEPGGARTEVLDQERYAAVVFHHAGCDDCFAAWQTRRRAFARPLAILMLPLDAIVGAAQAFAAKVAAAAAAAATSVLGRLGMGGAAAGGGVATIGAKATAVCVGVVCAATAGGEIAGVLPPIASAPAPVTRTQDAPEHANTPAQPAADTSAPVTPAVTPPPPPPPVAPATSSTADPASSSTPPPPAAPPAAVTPGDLPAAGATSPQPATPTSATRSATPPPPPPPPPAARPGAGAGGGSSSCVPGTLGC
jgi:hypothetical protein